MQLPGLLGRLCGMKGAHVASGVTTITLASELMTCLCIYIYMYNITISNITYKHNKMAVCSTAAQVGCPTDQVSQAHGWLYIAYLIKHKPHAQYQIVQYQVYLTGGPVIDHVHDWQQGNFRTAFSAPRALKPHCCHADHETQTRQVSSLHRSRLVMHKSMLVMARKNACEAHCVCLCACSPFACECYDCNANLCLQKTTLGMTLPKLGDSSPASD